MAKKARAQKRAQREKDKPANIPGTGDGIEANLSGCDTHIEQAVKVVNVRRKITHVVKNIPDLQNKGYELCLTCCELLQGDKSDSKALGADAIDQILAGEDDSDSEDPELSTVEQHVNSKRSHRLMYRIDERQVWCHTCAQSVDPQSSTVSSLSQVLVLIHQNLTFLGELRRTATATMQSTPVSIGPSATPRRNSKSRHTGDQETGGANGAVTGLVNLGNTCFFNAVMQNICWGSGVTEYFKHTRESRLDCVDGFWHSSGGEVKGDNHGNSNKSDDDDANKGSKSSGSTQRAQRKRDTSKSGSVKNYVELDEYPWPIVDTFRVLLSEMNGAATKGTANPRRLFLELVKIAPHFEGYQQQDSHEALRYLMDGWRTAENERRMQCLPDKLKVKGMRPEELGSFVDSLYGGRICNTVLCHTCHKSSVMSENFFDLSLPMPKIDRSDIHAKGTNTPGSAPRMSKHQKKMAARNERKQNAKGKRANRRKASHTHTSTTESVSATTEDVAQTEHVSEGEGVEVNGDLSETDSTIEDSTDDIGKLEQLATTVGMPVTAQVCDNDGTANDSDTPHSGNKIVPAADADADADEDETQLLAGSTKCSKTQSNGMTVSSKASNSAACYATEVDSSAEMQVGKREDSNHATIEAALKDVNLQSLSSGSDRLTNGAYGDCSTHCNDDDERSGSVDVRSKLSVEMVDADECGALEALSAYTTQREVEDADEADEGIEMEKSECKASSTAHHHTSNASEISNTDDLIIQAELVPVKKSGCGRKRKHEPQTNMAEVCDTCIDTCSLENKTREEASIECGEDSLIGIVRADALHSKSEPDSGLCHTEMEVAGSVKNSTFTKMSISDETSGDLAPVESRMGSVSSVNMTPDESLTNPEQNSNVAPTDSKDTLITASDSESAVIATLTTEADSQNYEDITPVLSDEEIDAQQPTLSRRQSLPRPARLNPNARTSPSPNAKASDSGRLSLDACLSALCSPEELVEDNRYRCETCKCLREATKWLLVDKIPRVLTVHLKRFEARGMRMSKITDHVDFPLVWDLTQYCSQTCRYPDGKVIPTDTAVQYRLSGIVVHDGGSLRGGHYTACLRNKNSTGWHYVSDTHHKAIDESKVLASQASILFYELKT